MSRITVDGRAADGDSDIARYDWGKFSVRIAVAIIIFVQVAFLAWSVSNTWFKQDDFVLLYRTTAEGGFPGSLLTVHGGHLIPGIIGVFWILRSLFDMAWWPFVVVIAGAQVVASYLTWRVLRSFFRARPIAVLLLLIYCASVLTFDANMWAISAILYLPLQIAFPATILILQRYIKRPSLGTAVGVVIPSFVAALFFEKALMIVPFVIVLCALTPLTKDAASSWTSRLREARKPLIAMTVMAIAYGIFYTILTRAAVARPNFTLNLFSRLDFGPFTQNLAPSLFGGPSRFSAERSLFGSISTTTDLEVFISLFLFSGLFAWSIIRRRTSIKYWILFAAMTIANLILITLANRSMPLTTRYMSDLVFPMVLLIGLAMIGNSNDLFERSLPSPPKIFRFSAFIRLALVTAVGVVIAVHSVTSQTTLKRAMSPALGKDYVETARRTTRTLTETPAAIEQFAPPSMINGIYFGRFRENITEAILRPADLNIRFGVEGENPFMILADGSVVPAKFDLVSQPVATGTPCLNQPYRNKTTLTMNNSPFLWWWYGRVKYTATSKAALSIVWSGRKVVIEIKPGSHTVFFPIEGGGQTLTFSVSNSGACIQEIEFLKMVDP